MGKYHHAIMGRVLRFMRTIFFARSISYFRCSIRKSSSKLTSHQRSTNVKTTRIAAMWNTNRFAYTLFDLLVLHRHEFHCLSSRIQPSCCRRKALSLRRRQNNAVFILYKAGIKGIKIRAIATAGILVRGTNIPKKARWS